MEAGTEVSRQPFENGLWWHADRIPSARPSLRNADYGAKIYGFVCLAMTISGRELSVDFTMNCARGIKFYPETDSALA